RWSLDLVIRELQSNSNRGVRLGTFLPEFFEDMTNPGATRFKLCHRRYLLEKSNDTHVAMSSRFTPTKGMVHKRLKGLFRHVIFVCVVLNNCQKGQMEDNMEESFHSCRSGVWCADF